MSTLTIRPAGGSDLRDVHRIIHDAASRLHGRGLDQWPHGSPSLGLAKLGAQIARGETFLVLDGREPVGTVALSPAGDRDFWRPAELAEPAVYLSKAAILQDAAGNGLGALVMRWAVHAAHAAGARWARLDAWRTNTGLHAYYARQGWDFVRMAEAPGRKSGALFQRLALPDPEALARFTSVPGLPRWQPAPVSALRVGARVVTQDWEAGVITDAHGPDWGYGVTGAAWEHSLSSPAATYTVQLDSGEVAFLGGGDLTEEAALNRAHWPRLAA